MNNTNFDFNVSPVGKILKHSFYSKNFKLYKKKIKTLPFKARNSLPVIITLEGLIHIPHLSISELNLFKKNIECRTIDFFDKKYDNII